MQSTTEAPSSTHPFHLTPRLNSSPTALLNAQVDYAFISPPIAAELVKNQELLDFVSSNLHSLFVTGGDIADSVRDKIAQRILLVKTYGSSEIINTPQLLSIQKDNYNYEEWKHLRFNLRMGVEFRKVNGSEEVFELIVIRYPELEDHQPVFKLYPELESFSTKDLWSPHLTKRDLWRYRGRVEISSCLRMEKGLFLSR
jgi:hypothetical protein